MFEMAWSKNLSDAVRLTKKEPNISKTDFKWMCLKPSEVKLLGASTITTGAKPMNSDYWI